MQNQHQLWVSGWDIVGGFWGSNDRQNEKNKTKQQNFTSANCHSNSRNIKIINKTHTKENVKIQLQMDDGEN